MKGGGDGHCAPLYSSAFLPSIFTTSLATMLAIMSQSPFLLCITLDEGSVANECMIFTYSCCLPRGCVLCVYV